MSGTSLDGIDAAVVDIERRKFRVVAHRTVPYPAALRKRILAVSNTEAHTREVARLAFELPQHYARAVRACGVDLKTIELTGCHGQTIFHERRSTLQIGDGSVLAELLGTPVVSDFRPRDMAAGGRGAPLVPFVDYWLFRHARHGRVALNLGGIGNITAIPAGASPEQVIAFDTGPGNMAVDQLMERYTNGRRRYDAGGKVAGQGKVNTQLLDKLLRAPFFRERPPKTAGREEYGKEFVDDLIATRLPLPDLIATATAFTAAAVAEGLDRFVNFRPEALIVSGGGAHNRTLLAYLSAFLPGVAVKRSDEFGIDPDAKEAIAFAILAYETWHRRPSNLPSATGAGRAAVLGKVSF